MSRLGCLISRVLGGSSKSARLSHELSVAQTLAVKLFDENEELRESYHRSLKREVWAHNTIAELKAKNADLWERLQRATAASVMTLEEQEQKGCGR